jgi:hypothetical protein
LRARAAHFAEDLEDLVATGQGERAAHASRVLEWIVDARHLAEFHRAVHVPRQPQLFEVSDVAQIPDDRAHQRVVLLAQLVVRQRLDQLNRSRTALREAAR